MNEHGKDHDGLHPLLLTLPQAWSPETAVRTTDHAQGILHPSAGQCAVTALAVWRRHGGQIIRGVMEDGNTHYWNILANGLTVDLTWPQFGPAHRVVITTGQHPGSFVSSAPRDPAILLSHPDTRTRAMLLERRLSALGLGFSAPDGTS